MAKTIDMSSGGLSLKYIFHGNKYGSNITLINI